MNESSARKDRDAAQPFLSLARAPRGLDEEPAPKASDVGTLLCATRMRLAKDLQVIAEVLHIRYNYLVAIEDGRYEDLPGQAYAVGFVRAYADHLGLDGGEVVRRFKEENSGLKRKATFEFPVPTPDSGVPSGVLLAVAVVMGMVVYGAWYSLAGSDRGAVEVIQEVPDRLTALLDQPPMAESTAVNAAENTAPVEDAATMDATTEASMSEETAATEMAATEMAEETPAVAETQTPEPTPVTTAPVVETPAPQPTPVVAEAPKPAAQTPAPVVETPVASTPVTPAPKPTPPPVQAETPAPNPAPATTTTAAVEPPKTEAPKVEAPKPAAAKPVETVAAKPVEAAPKPAETKPAPAAETPAAAETKTETAAETATAPQVASLPTAETPPDTAVIELRAKSDSWIQVRAGEQLLLTRLLRKGEVYLVPNDRSGLTLMTGNAGGLEVLVDGTVAPPLGTEGVVARGVPLNAAALRAGIPPAQ